MNRKHATMTDGGDICLAFQSEHGGGNRGARQAQALARLGETRQFGDPHEGAQRTAVGLQDVVPPIPLVLATPQEGVGVIDDIRRELLCHGKLLHQNRAGTPASPVPGF